MAPPAETNQESEIVTWKAPPLDLSDMPPTLFAALIKAQREHGGATKILQDQDESALSFTALVQAAYAIGAQLKKITDKREAVGVLLPTCAPAMMVFFGLQSAGRIPAILNFLAGASKVRAACGLAHVKTVVTSRRFSSTAKLEHLVSSLKGDVDFVYLEDLKNEVSLFHKINAGIKSRLTFLNQPGAKPDDAAVILFTSGTTGLPKGVALSHANLLANIAQCRAHIPFNPDWVFFNVLPVFHAFGLTGGALLPILGGIKTVLYPSPLDRERVPAMIRKTGANVLIATDTFARLYARTARENALRGLNYAVLGGERITETTMNLFAEKSSAVLIQGYGATECSPVVCVNNPDRNKPETVGQLLPGMEACLAPVPGIKAGALLSVRGPNVMLGYLEPDGDGIKYRRPDEWFDTGDLAAIDAEGYVTINGRISRFARIGAEMVSLTAVEDHANSCWPDGNHAAVALSEEGDREIIVLVTDQKDAQRMDLLAWAQNRDISNLEIPQRIITIRRVPILPTGKPDYFKIQKIIERRFDKVAFRTRHAKGASGAERKVRST